MEIRELLKLGDKIDIRIQDMVDVSAEKNEVQVYKSVIQDFLTDTALEIGMPTNNGKMVLFHIGLRLELIFYTKTGLYTASAEVLDRYKRGNLYMISINLISALKKYQRRAFYRINICIDVNYFEISREVAEYPRTEDLYRELVKEEYQGMEQRAVALDISGGGIRFIGNKQLTVGEHVLLKIQLSNSKVEQLFFLATRIVASEIMENDRTRFQNRGEFLFKELKDREAIVRFIFEEERRMRNRNA